MARERVLSPQTDVCATPASSSPLMPPKRGPGRPRKQPIGEAVSKKQKNAPGEGPLTKKHRRYVDPFEKTTGGGDGATQACERVDNNRGEGNDVERTNEKGRRTSEWNGRTDREQRINR